MADHPPRPALTISAGEQSFIIEGQLAAIIGQLVLHRLPISEIVVGSITVDIANGKAALRLTTSYSAERFDLQ